MAMSSFGASLLQAIADSAETLAGSLVSGAQPDEDTHEAEAQEVDAKEAADAKEAEEPKDLKKLMARVIDKRLKKHLSSLEAAGGTRQKVLEEALTNVIVQLEAIHNEVAALREAMGRSNQGREAFHEVAGQWESRVAVLQEELGRVQMKASRVLLKSAPAGQMDSATSSQELGSFQKKPRAASKSSRGKRSSTSSLADDIQAASAAAAEEEASLASAQQSHQCASKQGHDMPLECRADLGSLSGTNNIAILQHILAERRGSKGSVSSNGGGIPEFHPSDLCHAGNGKEKDCGSTSASTDLERLSVCSTVTLFDSRSPSTRSQSKGSCGGEVLHAFSFGPQ